MNRAFDYIFPRRYRYAFSRYTDGGVSNYMVWWEWFGCKFLVSIKQSDQNNGG